MLLQCEYELGHVLRDDIPVVDRGEIQAGAL
jgi:hypothetical protein